MFDLRKVEEILVGGGSKGRRERIDAIDRGKIQICRLYTWNDRSVYDSAAFHFVRRSKMLHIRSIVSRTAATTRFRRCDLSARRIRMPNESGCFCSGAAIESEVDLPRAESLAFGDLAYRIIYAITNAKVTSKSVLRFNKIVTNAQRNGR